MQMTRRISILILALATLQFVGCATAVKPWEKGILAKSHMAIETDPLDRLLREQVVTSKEASSGGYGVVGGGCGCK